MRERYSGRKGKIFRKFQDMSPGQELRVGIHPNYKADLYACAARLGMLATVVRTTETAQREDGVTVPVYLVSFR